MPSTTSTTSTTSSPTGTAARRRPRRRTAGRAAVVLGTAAALALAAPLAASAHVHVEPGEATAGGWTVLTFRVPNESATAGTTSVVVDLPTDQPFTSVSTEPVPGWTAEVTRGTLPEGVEVGGATVTEAPTTVTWTAEPGVQLSDGEFQRFSMSAGPVPETDSILLPVHQGYSDGTVVDWDEPTPASGEEPEHPAPELVVSTAATEGGHGAHGGAATGDADADSASDEASGGATASAGSDPLAVGLGLGGLALGAVALVLSVLGLTRGRRAGAGR